MPLNAIGGYSSSSVLPGTVLAVATPTTITSLTMTFTTPPSGSVIVQVRLLATTTSSYVLNCLLGGTTRTQQIAAPPSGSTGAAVFAPADFAYSGLTPGATYTVTFTVTTVGTASNPGNANGFVVAA